MLFVSQTFLACLWESHYRKGMWRYLPLALLFPIYYWFVIAPTFVSGVASAIISPGRGDAQWEPTVRTAVV
jgi:hypothetical protein